MTSRPLLTRVLPPRLRGYRRQYAGGDLVAGMLVAALAVPQALGYATVAGVPVQVGLYTLPPALIAYALVGSSRVLYVGPVSTVTVLSGSIVHQLSRGDPERAADLTSALALVAGVMLLVAGLVRIGWVARFLNQPIVTGFVTGLVVLIVVGEIPGLLGLAPPQGALLDRLLALTRDVQDSDPTTLLVSSLALALLFGGSRALPRIPWAAVVLVAGIVVSRAADLADLGVRVVGAVPSGLPVPTLPAVGLSELGALVTGGIAVAGVGIAEGLAAARTFAYTGHKLHDDTELVANGAADVAAGLFGGMGVAGSLSKTAANARAGARTQMSGVVSAGAVLLVLLFATGLLATLPRAVLSAIVIHAVWGLMRPREFVRYAAVRRNDGLAAVVAFVGVLALGPLNGLLVAIGQSLLGLVYRSMQVEVDDMGKVPGEKAAWGSIAHDPSRKGVPGICVLRPDGPIFWANAGEVFDRIEALLAARPDLRAVILDLEATNQLDTTTAERLGELLDDLRSRGVELYLVRVFGNVRAVLDRAGLLAELGEDRLWHSISAGVKAAKHLAAAVAGPEAAAPTAADTVPTVTDETVPIAVVRQAAPAGAGAAPGTQDAQEGPDGHEGPVDLDEDEDEDVEDRIATRWTPRTPREPLDELMFPTAAPATRWWQNESFASGMPPRPRIPEWPSSGPPGTPAVSATDGAVGAEGADGDGRSGPDRTDVPPEP